jgi:hypothetical protein
MTSSIQTGLEASWQEHHRHSFVESGQSYKRLRAAYRTGYEGAQEYPANLKPDELASRLEQDYARLCDQYSVGWEHGRAAALAAYARAAEQCGSGDERRATTDSDTRRQSREGGRFFTMVTARLIAPLATIRTKQAVSRKRGANIGAVKSCFFCRKGFGLVTRERRCVIQLS